MEHSAYQEMLSALLDGELSDAERETALAHMDGCADCRAYFDELSALRAALGDLDEFDAPEGFAAGVMARLRAGDGAIAPLRADNTTKTVKKHFSRHGYAALAACAAVVLLAVYALPNTLRMGSMGGGNNASNSAVYASPSTTGAADAPSSAQAAPAAAADSASGYVYSDGAGAVMESSTEEENGEKTVFTSNGTANADNGDARAAANGTAGSAADTLASEGEKDNEKMSIANSAEEPMMPLSRPEAYGEDFPILTLSGEGAALWLAEHGWQGESGAWYADAAALRALPENLSVVYGELSEDYDGAVLVELWEEEP